MSLFAEFSPEAAGPEPLGPEQGLVIREATDADVPALAQIAAEREGDDPSDHLSSFERLLNERRATGKALVLVAQFGGEIVGYGKATYFIPAPDAPDDVAPEGWYLGGVVVVPGRRRRGIGDQLTLARLQWIAERSSRAYYFANARNRVSIELHRRFGFVELTRSFSFPGVGFQEGVGILFSAELREGREE